MYGNVYTIEDLLTIRRKVVVVSYTYFVQKFCCMYERRDTLNTE